jgi:hypothetical protein
VRCAAGAVVYLQGGVVDYVVVLEDGFEVAADGVAVRREVNEDMRGERGRAGGDVPDVVVVDFCDCGAGGQSGPGPGMRVPLQGRSCWIP